MARARRGRRRRHRSGITGWLLAAGLVTALGAGGYFWWQRQDASPGATPAAARQTEATRPRRPAEPPDKPVEDPARFEFYDLLPDQVVRVPDQGDRPAGTPPPPLRAPGVYVVQAGSFPNFAEADAVKARLALLGIESQIQTISVDGRTFHRVRIGPVEDPAALNRIRTRLTANRLEYLVVQVTE